ncbi:hypothetical protein FJZ17_03065 [Candidatus Pacearchaeota archaeon]|nr:hypothetical protein [Candidatus Pacearchaeota archaeon]
MDKNLYLVRACRYVEADPVRGVRDSGTNYGGHKVVIASSPELANDKLLAHLAQNTRYRNWEISETRELTAGTDIPLQKRVEILREVFPIIE